MNKSQVALLLLLSGSVYATDWAPLQATGPADTHEYGDRVTAWASATEDGQPEWLLVQFAEPVEPATLRVFESYNPGALRQVTALDDQGQETTLWQGIDPLQGRSTLGVAELTLKPTDKVQRIKLYLASDQVPGWNEIDAVELIATNGSRQWASQAIASSTYGAAALDSEDIAAELPSANDEFTALLTRPLRIQLVGGQWLSGTLQHNGLVFLRLQVGAEAKLINKSQILQVELTSKTP